MSEGYTWAADPDAEAVASNAVELVRRALVETLPAPSYRAILLVGGYGRGEGGVLRSATGVRLHNNLDLLIVAAGPWVVRRRWLHARAAEAMRPLAARIGVGIDVGVIGEWTLSRAPCRVFYYDLRHGHRTLAGDPSYAPALPFTSGAIVGEDMLALVANRGTLLAINQELFAKGSTSRSVVTKHAVKAILGYGDGWLWTRALYHWSYGERLRRMRMEGAPAWLASLYERAAQQRFTPRADAFDDVDLAAWSEELVDQLEPLHRAVVERVDGRFAGWGEHIAAHTPGARVAAWLGRRPALHRMFPLVVYRQQPAQRALAARLLGVPPLASSVRRAYLRAWGVDGDPNFGAAASSMGLSIGASP